jgi:hypothetical protein
VTCEELRRDAAGLAALAEGDPDRTAAYTHARSCAACAAELRRGERLVALLEAAAPARAPSPALRRAAAPILEDLPATPPRLLLPVAAAVGALLAAVAARSHSTDPLDALAAIALAAIAIGLAALAPRAGGRVVGAALVVSALAAALEGAVGPLTPLEGVKCVGVELAAAAVPLLAVVAVWRRSGASAPVRLAAAAAAGALAGQAALALTCHAPDAALHVAAFHLGGVLAAAALGAATGRLLRAAPEPA